VQTITNGGVGTADSASNIAIVGGTNYFVGVSGTSRTESGNFTINADFNPDPSQGNQTIVGTSSSETLTGGPGNDTLSGLGGDDFIDGGAGLDTAVYAGPRSSYSISASGNSFIVHAFSGTDGNDTVTNVERLHFSTSSVALDLDGNAGLTAKILGAVFGPASVSNKVFVGIGLNLLDSGMSYGDLMQLALDAAGVTSHTQEVRLLWTNLFGSAPSAADAAPFVTWLDTGFVSTSQLAVMAGELSNNASNINLVGLHLTGIEFV
jgi:serralysin